MTTLYHPSIFHHASVSTSPTVDNSQPLSMNSYRNSPYDSQYLQANGSSTSIDSGSSMSLMDQVKSWNDAQVKQWMIENRVGNYADLFAKNDIRGSVLLDMDQESLKELGLRLVGDRTKIMIAIKKLRAQCASSSGSTISNHSLKKQVSIPAIQQYNPAQIGGRERSESSASSASNHQYGASRPSTTASSNPSVSSSRPPTGQHRRPGSKGGTGKVPPPLHLTQSSSRDLGQAYQTPHYPQTGNHLVATPANEIRPSPRQPPQTLPPPLPSKTPNLLSSTNPPPSSHQRAITAPQGSASSQPWAGDYGLPKAPAPGNLLSASTKSRGASKSPNTIAQGLPETPGYHRKSPSLSQVMPPTVSVSSANQRPSTAQTPNQGGFYAGSPTEPSYRKPSNYEAHQNLEIAVPQRKEAGGLGFSVGKGGFGRPSTPAGTVSVGGHGTTPSLDDLMNKTVKFKGDDGVSKMMHFSDSDTASQVMLTVLRKFGKFGKDQFPQDFEDSDDDEDMAEMEGWGVFGSTADGQTKGLTKGELMDICRNGTRADRQRGLMLRKMHHSDGPKRKNRKLQEFFGIHGPTIATPSSPYLDLQIPATQIEPASPPTPHAEAMGGAYTEEYEPETDATFIPRKMNRASTISVMSGLGVVEASQAAQQLRSPSSGVPVNGNPAGVRFQGQRPPSEIINGNFTDFFPQADQKKLTKNVRKSIRLSMRRRDSQYIVPDPRGDWDSFQKLNLNSRFSNSTIGSHRMSTMDTTPDGSTLSSVDSHLTEHPASVGMRNPPQRQNAQDRLSVVSQIRNSMRRPDSDNASLLTMDEVAAEVENRRLSVASWMVGDDDDDFDRPLSSNITPIIDEEEEEDDEETEDEEDKPQAYTSQGAKAQVKWIKGTLIGAGSFGSVYLGMNSTNGTLMAVKQVELPTGNSHNEERKKSMLEALEREIELLKELQHERIVQYLDSSSDGVHLNIFLEYVPGGSVQLLLKTYGAFEEALTRTWSSQILEGLQYLHEKDIIHRDIKGANVLVDNKGGIKISDFGISKKVEDGTLNLLATARVHRPSLQGSVFWMAPEVVKQTSYTKKADIWSLGCLIIEMLTGSHPWANLTQMQAIFKIGSSARPTIPDDITEHAQHFLEQTFLINHLERPTAAELLKHPWQTSLIP
ncbi:Pkinase-domain-containing protein [Atractiella rhizophila]|nr:Pkinase-domain-containing protein [Atractiella rhizophila]